MKCNLTIDVGNSHIVFGVFENDILLQSWRLKSDKTRTGDEYFSVIQNLIKTNMLDSGNFRIAVLASVVPVLSNVFVHLIKKYFACPVI
nr:type III pantothenate kinase [Candidatus Cloacimonadota bacterium]